MQGAVYEARIEARVMTHADAFTTGAAAVWPIFVAAVLILAAAYLVARCCRWVRGLFPDPYDATLARTTAMLRESEREKQNALANNARLRREAAERRERARWSDREPGEGWEER